MLYRTKPVIIEANVFRGGAESATAIINWSLNYGSARSIRYHSEDDTLRIDTEIPGPPAVAYPGDYIVRNTFNEFYPSLPGNFEATHEPVV